MLQQGSSLDWLSDHNDYLYRFAISRVKNREAAQDMVQETLIAAWKGRESFNEHSSIRTWLTAILKYKIVDHIRSEIRHRNTMDAFQHDPSTIYYTSEGHWLDAPNAWRDCPEYLFNRQQIREELETGINALPQKQQIVYRMRELIGETTDSICKHLNITPGHLNVLFHRARLSLHKHLLNEV